VLQHQVWVTLNIQAVMVVQLQPTKVVVVELLGLTEMALKVAMVMVLVTMAVVAVVQMVVALVAVRQAQLLVLAELIDCPQELERQVLLELRLEVLGQMVAVAVVLLVLVVLLVTMVVLGHLILYGYKHLMVRLLVQVPVVVPVKMLEVPVLFTAAAVVLVDQ
jgi:hypothetical protein